MLQRALACSAACGTCTHCEKNGGNQCDACCRGLTPACTLRTPRKRKKEMSERPNLCAALGVETNLFQINHRVPRVAPQQSVRVSVLVEFYSRVYAPFDARIVVNRKNAAIALAVGLVVLRQTKLKRCNADETKPPTHLNHAVFEAACGECYNWCPGSEKLVLQSNEEKMAAAINTGTKQQQQQTTTKTPTCTMPPGSNSEGISPQSAPKLTNLPSEKNCPGLAQNFSGYC